MPSKSDSTNRVALRLLWIGIKRGLLQIFAALDIYFGVKSDD